MIVMVSILLQVFFWSHMHLLSSLETFDETHEEGMGLGILPEPVCFLRILSVDQRTRTSVPGVLRCYGSRLVFLKREMRGLSITRYRYGGLTTVDTLFYRIIRRRRTSNLPVTRFSSS